MSSGENPESPRVSASTTLAHTLLAALWHCESRLDFWGHRNGKNARALLHGTTFAIIGFTLNANTTQVLLLRSKSTLITAGNQMYAVFQGAPQHRVFNLSCWVWLAWVQGMIFRAAQSKECQKVKAHEPIHSVKRHRAAVGSTPAKGPTTVPYPDTSAASKDHEVLTACPSRLFLNGESFYSYSQSTVFPQGKCMQSAELRKQKPHLKRINLEALWST